MKNILAVLLVCIFSIEAFAAGGSSAGLTTEVWAFIKLQIVNFVVFAGLIIFLSRSKIAPAFKQFKEDYLAKSQEAQRKLDEAKAERDNLSSKITKLQDDFSEAVAKAESQAEGKYKAKLAEVKNNISAMNKDLEGQIEGLKRSQASSLKNLLMESSIDELKKDLGSDVDEQLLIQLQNSFVESVARA